MMKFIIDSVENGCLTLRAPGTNYRHTFQCSGGSNLSPGGKVFGAIYAAAYKIEPVSAGGNYVEPVFGRPRRMQGLVVAQHPDRNELVVRVGYDVVVKAPTGQNASDFAVGSRVGWDNAADPRFELEAVNADKTT